MPRATARATLALFLVGLWMALLFAGHPAGGVTHLLLLAALAVFPWRAAKAGSLQHDDRGQPDEQDFRSPRKPLNSSERTRNR